MFYLIIKPGQAKSNVTLTTMNHLITMTKTWYKILMVSNSNHDIFCSLYQTKNVMLANKSQKKKKKQVRWRHVTEELWKRKSEYTQPQHTGLTQKFSSSNKNGEFRYHTPRFHDGRRFRSWISSYLTVVSLPVLLLLFLKNK